MEGFFRSIALSHGSSLQDTLRLLTLWFDYGQWPEVYDAIVEGIRTIEIDTWLQVFKKSWFQENKIAVILYQL